MSTATKKIKRSPRYLLTDQDANFLCFVSKKQKKRTYSSKILNVSLTGLAFVIEKNNAPKLDEKLLLEFQVPGNGPIACQARIIRIQNYKLAMRKTDPDLVKVAIEFEDLTLVQVDALQHGLIYSFKQNQKKERAQKLRNAVLWPFTTGRRPTLYALIILSILGILVYLTQRSENYLPEIKIPWGTRF